MSSSSSAGAPLLFTLVCAVDDEPGEKTDEVDEGDEEEGEGDSITLLLLPLMKFTELCASTYSSSEDAEFVLWSILGAIWCVL